MHVKSMDIDAVTHGATTYKGSKGKWAFEREKVSTIKMGNWKEINEAKRKLVRRKERKEIKKYRTFDV